MVSGLTTNGANGALHNQSLARSAVDLSASRRLGSGFRRTSFSPAARSLGIRGCIRRTIGLSPGVYVVRNGDLSAAHVGVGHKRSVQERLRDHLAGDDLTGLGERAMDAALADRAGSRIGGFVARR